jgi:hypothetical protein
MKRRIIAAPSGVLSILNVNTVKRGQETIIVNETPISITGYWTSLPTDYNDIGSYIRNRAVDIIPESTSDNTLITNDGLIIVFASDSEGNNKTLTLIDMFEVDTSTTYGTINSNGYLELEGYSDSVNPLNRKLFIANISVDNDNEYVTIGNDRVYSDDDNTHFVSQMDYTLVPGLDFDTDYNFRVSNDDWNEEYSFTDNFVFYKKQFFFIKLVIDDIVVPVTVESIVDENPTEEGVTPNFENISGTNFFRVSPLLMNINKIQFRIKINSETSYANKKGYLEVI